jgi:hypothetical protein
MSLRNYKTHSDCECCPNTDTDLFLVRGNMWMCTQCKENDEKFAAEAKLLAEKSRVAQSIVHSARKIDESNQVVGDIYLAKTVAAVELKAAIWNDDSIPESDKQLQYTLALKSRRENAQKILFDLKKQVGEMENEHKMWQIETQNNVALLSEELRKQFKELDVTYAPAKVKSIKAVSYVAPKTAEIREVAARFGLESSVLTMVAKANKMNAEAAAKYLVELKRAK